jgi:hypothetical protein
MRQLVPNRLVGPLGEPHHAPLGFDPTCEESVAKYPMNIFGPSGWALLVIRYRRLNHTAERNTGRPRKG